MRTLGVIAVAVLLAGCATAPPSAPAAGGQTFSGEVWTWDEPNNVVTLYQGGQITRVKVSREQLRALQLHQPVRVTGEVAPAGVEHTVLTPGPVTPVAKGEPAVLEVKGTVASVDASGHLAVDSERGPVHVWAAPGADQRFPRGGRVSVTMRVQPVDMVPATTPPATPPSPASSEPGDYAVVTGRIVAVNPGGVLVVESPSGPVQVLVSDGGRFKAGDWVQIHTTIRVY